LDFHKCYVFYPLRRRCEREGEEEGSCAGLVTLGEEEGSSVGGMGWKRVLVKAA
jgi:hypothetical protein